MRTEQDQNELKSKTRCHDWNPIVHTYGYKGSMLNTDGLKQLGFSCPK